MVGKTRDIQLFVWLLRKGPSCFLSFSILLLLKYPVHFSSPFQLFVKKILTHLHPRVVVCVVTSLSLPDLGLEIKPLLPIHEIVTVQRALLICNYFQPYVGIKGFG